MDFQAIVFSGRLHAFLIAIPNENMVLIVSPDDSRL